MPENNKEEDFIEIKRVVSNKGVNVSSNLESFPVGSVYSFRPWHKGNKDAFITGEMTQLLVFRDPEERGSKVSAKVVGGSVVESRVDGKLKSILIEESYAAFVARFSVKKHVRRVE